MLTIETTILPATSHRGTRIRARTVNGHRLVIPYDHAAPEPHRRAAQALCARLGWSGVLAEGDTHAGRVFVVVDDTTTFSVSSSSQEV